MFPSEFDNPKSLRELPFSHQGAKFNDCAKKAILATFLVAEPGTLTKPPDTILSQILPLSILIT
jgi:hypothetical protein